MQLLAEFISSKRLRIKIKGIVQGVGFRPFIYKLANKYTLTGFIHNNGDGVSIEVEGEKQRIESFICDLKNLNPPLSRIDSITKENIVTQNSHNFTIIESKNSAITTMMSSDISICYDCLAEMKDKKNRRYRYPFINCTNCGPRYSIINNLPYDRDKTSMNIFSMCSACKKEYIDPNNRRYHAQPISCYECGPKLRYISLSGEEQRDEKKAFKKICNIIKSGKSVALKGVGGFHIVCDATNEKAINLLRKSKNRQTKPFAVMFKSIRDIKKVCKLSKKDEILILSKERPIVIVSKKENKFLAKSIAPNIDKIGVFLPYTPLHKLILDELNFPIIATSANMSDEPIIVDEKEIFLKMPLVVQDILTHDRDIVNACDDSVVLNTKYEKITLRMARGYAPNSFYFKEKTSKKILALGANQKVTLTLAFDNNIVVSPHIGDLNSIDSFDYFLRTLEMLKRVYNFEAEVMVCDKHPNYETSCFARKYVKKETNIKLIEVQHHYAHALSCMAEHSLDEEVLAFCFDGTGFGNDGTLWGGEVFVADTHKHKRIFHFNNITLLGGEIAVKEPKRVALSLLFSSFSLEEILLMKSELVNSFKVQEIKVLHKMFTHSINSPKSSSLGRLFDGVYALSGYLKPLEYEGESGLILESISNKSKSIATYKYNLENGVIEYSEMIKQIIQESDSSKIAKKFISTISKIILDIARKYPHLPLVLSGGVFQNRVLVSQLTKELKKIDRKYFIQSKIPINDGGISLGQAYFAIKNT